MSRMLCPIIEALKISAPDRDFAAESKARFMGGTEKARKCGTFECRALKMEIFRGLEDANFAKNENAKKLVALARGKPQVWQDGPRLAPPVIPPDSADGKKRR